MLILMKLKPLGNSEEMTEAIEEIRLRFSTIIYNSAVEKLLFVQNNIYSEGYYIAEKLFRSIPEFKNSAELADLCEYNANVIKFNMVINKLQLANDVQTIDECEQEFRQIENFDKAQEMAKECENMVENISLIYELKRLVSPVVSSYDIDTLKETKRKALAMNGIGNSALIAAECQRKIECIQNGEKFVPRVRSASYVRDDPMLLKAEFKKVQYFEKTNRVIIIDGTEKLCRKCGKKIEDDTSSFCRYCGAVIK